MCRKWLAGTALLVGVHLSLGAQVREPAYPSVTENINENRTVTLHGNTHPEADAANDRGAVNDNFQINHMFLQMRRPPELQKALHSFLNQLHDPNSPNFHRWLTAEQFGQQFGLARQDLEQVSAWLESHGFTVNAIYPNLAIDFTGTSGQITRAFHTEIHHLLVDGKRHYANMTDPQIPAALGSLISGIGSLNDFKPHPLSRRKPAYVLADGSQIVVPSDIAAIYHFNAAFGAGFSGLGQTIAVLEDSDLYSSGDWLVFRKVFGFARAYSHGALMTVHPNSNSASNCVDPGVNPDDVETIVDAEWATAAAPNATIEVASCASSAMFGGLVALQNLLASETTPPAIVSLSFGMTEADLGAANNAYISSLYQLADAEGVSIFVATGDSGAALQDGLAGYDAARSGISVSGYASTPYNVAVGATDFADTYLGTTSQYWSSTNSPTYGSALSYIPEITWNDSCASQLLATSNGFSTGYGVNGYCNNGGPLTITAGGGGPSNCATGSPFGTGSNACAGYSKPSWQDVAGNPNDGVRDIPDVALFGSDGRWGHYYVVCFSDLNDGGSSCLGTPSTWSGFGGTSITAPIMAGIQALVNQKTGSRWGNPNSVYYKLASSEYGANGNVSCESTSSSLSTSCIFHDITMGDIVVDCVGRNNCYYGPNPGSFGALSISDAPYEPAFAAAIGWDFATGIGSVDAWNLITNWPASILSTAPSETATPKQ